MNKTGKGGFKDNPKNINKGIPAAIRMEHNRFKNLSMKALQEEIIVAGQPMSILEAKIKQLLRSDNPEGFKWMIQRLFGKADQVNYNIGVDVGQGLSEDTIRMAQEKMLGIYQDAPDEEPDK